MLTADQVKWPAMNSDDLTPEQAGTLYRGLVGGMNYLLRLRTRMEKAGFKYAAMADGDSESKNKLRLTCFVPRRRMES
jgi:hypothetical protein